MERGDRSGDCRTQLQEDLLKVRIADKKSVCESSFVGVFTGTGWS